MNNLFENIKTLDATWPGDPIPDERLDWFSTMFENFYNKKLPSPHIFPTLQGGIQAEWNLENHDISLEVDLNAKTAFYHEWNFVTDEDTSSELDLSKQEGWTSLNNFLMDVFIGRSNK